jgi:hypothetical protein
LHLKIVGKHFHGHSIFVHRLVHFVFLDMKVSDASDLLVARGCCLSSKISWPRRREERSAKRSEFLVKLGVLAS